MSDLTPVRIYPLLGLVESFAYGWYIAVIFVPAFNFFSGRKRT